MGARVTDEQLYCDGPSKDEPNGCARPVAGHGHGGTGTPKCESHLRQLGRTGKMTPIAEKLSPEERAVVAGTAMLEADSEEDYKAHRRTWLSACAALGGKAGPELANLKAKVTALEQELSKLADEMRRQRSEEVKAGLSAARAKGVRLGRPPKVSLAELERLFSLLGSGVAVARVLRMHQATVNDRLSKAFGKRRISRITNGPRPT